MPSRQVVWRRTLAHLCGVLAPLTPLTVFLGGRTLARWRAPIAAAQQHLSTAAMSAHAAAAMSNAVLNSLNRLSDGHTRRTAWNELTTFAEQLDAQRLPGFLACLHATNDRYTIACRRGAIQLYGRLGGMHPQLLAPRRVTQSRECRSHRVRGTRAGLLRTYVPEAPGSLPGGALRYVRRTRASLGRAVRTSTHQHAPWHPRRRRTCRRSPTTSRRGCATRTRRASCARRAPPPSAPSSPSSAPTRRPSSSATCCPSWARRSSR